MLLRVYACVTQEHDLRLVVVAGVICLLSSYIAFAAFDQARRDAARKLLWTELAAVVAGLGIWATHFVAMLAYQPALPVGYDFATTLLSVSAAILVTGLGWAAALTKRRGMALLGGAIVGAGVGTMHYIGMAAVEVAGFMVWDRPLVIASVAIGIVLSAAAMRVHMRAAPKLARFAPVVLTLAICALHFTAMAAASIYPSNAVVVPPSSVDSETLAIVITAGILVIFCVGFGVILHERGLARARVAEAEQRTALADEILRGAAEREALALELERAAVISTAALESMAQGLSMHDADNRLMTYNRQYAELYDLPDDLLAPGTPLKEIMGHLIETGVVSDDWGRYDDDIQAGAVHGRQVETALCDGRIIEICMRPTPTGGWVATHEDVTEARRAADRLAYLAEHDTLTGLPNRTAFARRLDEAIEAGGAERGFAVLTIDLDRFKEVNDTLGHPFGDLLLKETADGCARGRRRARDHPPRRRRVRRAPSRRGRAPAAGELAATDHRHARPAVPVRRPHRGDRREHRDQPGAARRHQRRGAAQAQRRRPVPRQGGKPRHLPLLRGRHGLAHAGTPRTRSRPQGRHPRRPVRGPLPAAARPRHGRDHLLRSARALAPSDPRACWRRPNSSRSPKRAT